MKNQSKWRALIGLSLTLCVVSALATPAPEPAATHPIPLRDEAAFEIIVGPDGMLSAELDGSFLSTIVAKIGPDGELITGCVTTREEYDAFFAADAPTVVPEVR